MKVYVVEVGAYSDRFIDSIFARRDDAEQYVIATARNSWHHYTNGQPFPEPEGRPFDEWYREVEQLTGNWGKFGAVEEFDVEEGVPVVERA